ncbi:MAG: S41 family peptidase [Anaerolineae bacterium]
MSKGWRQRSRLGLVVVVCLCLAYGAGFRFYSLRRRALTGPPGGPVEAEIFWEAWYRVEKHFIGPVPSPRTRTHAAIRQSLALLDPYTALVEPVPRELERDRVRGSHGGIGAAVWRNLEGHIALDPYPDSPAARAGLTRGDVLLAIDGEPVLPQTSENDIERNLRGQLGTRVEVEVRRPSGSRLSVGVVRERIEMPSVTWRLETPTVAYVRLTEFTDRTGPELDAALEGARRARAISLVLDLRGNKGGLLDPAIEVAGRFLREGDVVVHQTSRTGERRFRAPPRGDVETPLVLLVDGGTASAAEIVAGALQYHNRALLVGEPTFGKGSVQEICDLSDGSSLHVTAAVWLTPDRRRIAEGGLTPDVLASSTDDSNDEALSWALEHLESE